MTQSSNLSGCQVFKEAALPADWDCELLGTRIELAYGKGLREQDRKPGKVDVYGSNGRIGSHDVALVNGAGILVGRKGTVGAVHYSPRSFWPIDTVYYVLQLADDDTRFLHHLLEYLPLRSLNAATGVPGLSRRDAYALRSAFPPPGEQADIARILDAVDTALERIRAAIERARELKQAVLNRFLHEALGSTAYANRPRCRLPDGWALVATGMLLAEEPRNGVSPQASSQPPGIPTFSIGAIREGRVDLEDRDNLKYVQISEDAARRYCIETGDVLIVRGNANPDLVGKAATVGTIFPRGCIYPDIAKRVIFRSNGWPKVLPGFAVLAWNHATVHNQVLQRAKTSNGTLKINSRDVKQIILPVPTEVEQAEIVGVISAVDAKRDALIRLVSAQEQLKKSLVHDLLTGRVRVRDASTAAAS